MKILALGIGKIGKALLKDMIKNPEVLEVVAGGIKEKGVLHASVIGWNTDQANKFFAELAKRNIKITKTITRPLTPTPPII